MNKIVLTGRFTKDIFLDKAQSGTPFCKFTVAARRGSKDNTDFFNCVAFNKKAETIVKYCTKGSLVTVSGVMQSSRPDKITYWEVLVDDIEFMSSKADGSDPTANLKKVEEEDEDLPF